MTKLFFYAFAFSMRDAIEKENNKHEKVLQEKNKK
jgi:hypothetical protein